MHGVVLSDVDDRLKDGPVLALRWTTTAEVDLALESFFGINLANDFEEFRAAFEGYGSPSQNFVYAEVDGHIGYVLPGLIPVRDGPDGLRVRDGESGNEEWTGYVPPRLPWQLDPVGGRIVTANNAPVDGAYPTGSATSGIPGIAPRGSRSSSGRPATSSPSTRSRDPDGRLRAPRRPRSCRAGRSRLP